MNSSTLHSCLFRYLNARPARQEHFADMLIVTLRETETITSSDSYRIFHETMGTPYDARIKSALDAIPVLDHPSRR